MICTEVAGMKRILVKIVLPVSLLAVWMITCYPICRKAEGFDFFLYWVLVGCPYGIRKMCMILIPKNFGIAGSIGILALNCIVGGLIGGVVVILRMVMVLMEIIKIISDTSGHDVQKSVEEPAIEKPVKQPAPKIDKSNAVNFHITDDALGAGSAKEKFRRNIEAIRTLEKVESENRIATRSEQQILSQYVGWGGLADAFDESKSAWAGEYQQLKELLSSQEYASARESTLNAHYTSPAIIRSIYDTLDRMGFEKGNVLEPAMGIGNFFGMLPEKMQESRLYGVELDGITGRIARQL